MSNACRRYLSNSLLASWWRACNSAHILKLVAAKTHSDADLELAAAHISHLKYYNPTKYKLDYHYVLIVYIYEFTYFKSISK